MPGDDHHHADPHDHPVTLDAARSWYVRARLVAYLGIALFLGGSGFVALLWPTGSAVRAARRVITTGWLLGVAGAAATIVLEGVWAGGGPIGWPLVTHVLATDFGRVWLAIALLWVLAGVVLADLLQRKETAARSAAWRIGALAVGLGLLAALYRNTWFDRGINMISLVSISFPEFFIAYIAIVLLASPLVMKILPPISSIQDDAGLGERLYRCALPAITMTLIIVAHMMRMTRAAIINVLASPYVEMARLKGARPWQIILRHALPNAWAPIVTVIALNLAYLIVGVVVVEFVFTYPGMGKLMVDAVTSRDVPVVQACALVFAATYIILNLIADVLGIVTNPRLLHPK